MIYVILGMHKSGTTLVSQLFHASGIPMLDAADDEAGYDEGHKFEDPRFRAINLRLLDAQGTYSLDIPLDGPMNVTPELATRADDLVQAREANASPWGFKDPRTTLTYPFWRDRLPEHRLVGVFRSPFEVWSHYGGRWRNLWSVLKHWTEHNRRMLSYLEASEQPGFLVEYEALMTSDEILRVLEDYVGTSLEDAREPSLYRSRIDPGLAARAMARGMGRVLPEDPLVLWSRLQDASGEVGVHGP